MPKSVIVLAVPGVVAGLSLLDGGDLPEAGYAAEPEVRLIEIGVAFDSEAVRASLPPGLEPADGLTGGVAVYFVTDGLSAVPRSAGYVWVDVKHGPRARYMLRSFLSEVTLDPPGERSDRLQADFAAGRIATDTPLVARIAVSCAVVVTGGPSRLDLVVDPVFCASVPEAVPLTKYLFASGLDEAVEVAGDPSTAGWCDAHVTAAGVPAPTREVLEPFAPERVLWTKVATPLGSAMPELPS